MATRTQPVWNVPRAAPVERSPFVAAADLDPLLTFLADRLPTLIAQNASADFRHVADGFARLCFHAAQASSHFPAFAENYAELLHTALKTARPSRLARFVAKLMSHDAESRCGFHPLTLADSALIRQSEQWLRDGAFEPFLKARAKYDEYDRRLRTEPGFRRDWRALRKIFPSETARSGILHRTLIPERNWVRDGGAKFRTRAQRFQACFDLLCWKYCLWGVGRGQPLLLKPSVVVTPYGTQIFVPAYMSFDAKRDLNLGLITRLHRARGQRRQGPGFSAARIATKDLRAAACAANREARVLKLRGERRYAHIRRALGWLEGVDPRQIRRLLAPAPKRSA